ncbi:DNA-binding response regulator [Companilactobacillus sp. RD055328]|uniref:response regulator transcription factor n=1 Tax=Companilactobacillus sp. RD055328 TaxID=2916634 RepID=UPI001FC7D5EE|nr:response regulator transcription factor [Companilactobacillus sp. RD055328]GKQ43056.1 DNA-binding response regulator [Companilactobacillus sp. RD055328]
MKILIVDDEISIATLLEYNLQQAEYETVVVHNGQDAFAKYQEEHFDVVILDLMLPKIDGITLAKKIRKLDNEIAILMLTALGTKQDVIKGLNSGADDYVVKPFSPEEIIARVGALVRRKSDIVTKSMFEVVGNKVQLPNGEEKELTKKENELLNYFIHNRQQVLSREQIMDNVWPLDDNSGRVVDMQIRHLREKIEEDPKNPQYLVTVRGFGYKLEE